MEWLRLARLHVYDFGVAFWIITIPSVSLGIEVTKVNVLHFLISSDVLAGPPGPLATRSLHAVFCLVRHCAATAWYHRQLYILMNHCYTEILSYDLSY